MSETIIYPKFFFFALFTALFLAIFYNTVTNMAGIYIVSDLGGSKYISVYSMVSFGVGTFLSLPLSHPLADRWGSIKLLVYGLFLYTLFSILCSVASTFFTFNAFRFGMGFASGVFYILCRRILILTAPPEKLPFYFFIMLVMYAVVPVLGTTWGAWLSYEGFWRSIFHFNEPIALFLGVYFWFLFSRDRST